MSKEINALPSAPVSSSAVCSQRGWLFRSAITTVYPDMTFVILLRFPWTRGCSQLPKVRCLRERADIFHQLPTYARRDGLSIVPPIMTIETRLITHAQQESVHWPCTSRTMWPLRQHALPYLSLDHPYCLLFLSLESYP
jgi:hypothetical protein